MSIDTYPYYELSNALPDVSAAVGAGSLLFRNVNEVWPDFAGRDIFTAFPQANFVNLACDGASTFDLLETDYLDFLAKYQEQFVVVTITIGGNDLLDLISLTGTGENSLQPQIEQILSRYAAVLDQITGYLPRAVIIGSTIYDPTDGAGDLPGFGNILAKLPYSLNQGIKDCLRQKSALLVDTHQHFLGHGMSVPADVRWYWTSPIEPSARGASELRRLWLEKLISVSILKATSNG
jgi:lysophospholipase L1-like esterase